MLCSAKQNKASASAEISFIIDSTHPTHRTPTQPGKYRNLKVLVSQPQLKKTSKEDDLNRKQPQWKMTSRGGKNGGTGEPSSQPVNQF